MNIGPYRLSSLETGRFALDGGAMFGVVPKPVWEKTNPADEKNRIDMRLRALLIQGNGRNILVDCGMGTKWADKYVGMYKIDHSKWSLLQGLLEKGLKPEDITDVVLTHLHFDHAGGMTTHSQMGAPSSPLIPVFPKAKVYLQRRNWELAWHPSEKDRASYLSENFSLYNDDPTLKRNLELIETKSIEPTGRETYLGPKSSETELFPGISVLVSNGHTLGMQVVRISDGKSTLYYAADLIPTATHVRTPFIMGYDCFPLFIMKEKKLLLERVYQEHGAIFYEHCPRMTASFITQTKDGDYLAGDPLNL